MGFHTVEVLIIDYHKGEEIVTISYSDCVEIMVVDEYKGTEVMTITNIAIQLHRKIADKVAAAGFYTVTPDFFFGDPYVSEEQKPMSVWLKEHGTDEGFKNARAVIEALKSKGITKIGAAGFCWGGKVAVELAKYHHYIQAGVLLHPTFVTLEDIQEVKVALSILGAEFDHITTPEILKQFEAALKANHEIDSFVKMFPGVSHGWTLRYDDDNEFEVKSAMEAQQDMLDWFVEHLS